MNNLRLAQHQCMLYWACKWFERVSNKTSHIDGTYLVMRKEIPTSK